MGSLSVTVLEKAARIGDVWRQRYERLHVHNLTDAIELPAAAFPDSFPAYLSKDDLAAFLEGYAVMLGLNVRTSMEVLTARYEEDCWSVEVAGPEGTLTFRARALVAATGFYGRPIIPAVPGTPHPSPGRDF